MGNRVAAILTVPTVEAERRTRTFLAQAAVFAGKGDFLTPHADLLTHTTANTITAGFTEAVTHAILTDLAVTALANAVKTVNAFITREAGISFYAIVAQLAVNTQKQPIAAFTAAITGYTFNENAVIADPSAGWGEFVCVAVVTQRTVNRAWGMLGLVGYLFRAEQTYARAFAVRLMPVVGHMGIKGVQQFYGFAVVGNDGHRLPVYCHFKGVAKGHTVFRGHLKCDFIYRTFL